MPVSCPKFDKPSHNGYISGLKINKIIFKFLKNIKLHRGVEQLVARRAHRFNPPKADCPLQRKGCVFTQPFLFLNYEQVLCICN